MLSVGSLYSSSSLPGIAGYCQINWLTSPQLCLQAGCIICNHTVNVFGALLGWALPPSASDEARTGAWRQSQVAMGVAVFWALAMGFHLL